MRGAEVEDLRDLEMVKCDLRSSLHDDGIADDSCHLSNGSAGRWWGAAVNHERRIAKCLEYSCCTIYLHGLLWYQA